MGQTLYTWFVSFTAAVGGLLFGYEIGIINSVLAIDSFQVKFGLNEWAPNREELFEKKADLSVKIANKAQRADIEGNIVSAFTFGCIIGALLIAFGADVLGRRRSIWLGSLLFVLGGLVQAVAETVGVMVAGRGIGGVGIGILSHSVPLFIAEVAPTNIRGTLTSIQQLMITIGIAIASIANAIIITAFSSFAQKTNDFMWRLALGIQCAPGIMLLGALFFIPESPRWLIMKGREDEGLTALSRLRSASPKAPEVQEEFHEFKQSIEAERSVGEANWSELLRPGIRNRVVIGLIIQCFQQWTGINAVMYYSSALYIGMGIPKATASTVNVVIQSLVNVFGTLPGMYLVERAGRKKLLVWGGLAMSATMWGLVIFVNALETAVGKDPSELTIDDPRPPVAATYGTIAVVLVYAYVLSFASTWGPVAWVYQSEIFPARVRGKGTGLATSSNWINNFILSKVWPYIQLWRGNQYIVPGCTGIAMAAYCQFFVPETKGRSLEDMDAIFGFTGEDRNDHFKA
ncbi:general substrate transporter [Paraphysoderma sedebokerense]|nr:general substrate transporter [Paraphysoderma sedebokerense]